MTSGFSANSEEVSAKQNNKNLLSYIDFYSDSELDVLRAKKFWPIFFFACPASFSAHWRKHLGQ